MRKVGRTDTIEVVATFVDDDNKELVTTDTNAFHNKELIAATLTVCCEKIDAVATNLATPKTNYDESKMTAEIEEYNMEQQIADDTTTTAGIHGLHTRPGAGAVNDRENLHGQHRDEDHHRAAFIKEDQEPRIGTALKIAPKTMYETHKKSVLNMTDTPRDTALAHYNNEFAEANLANDDKEFIAALTANGIKFAVNTLATDTLDEELVAAATFATFATNIEKFADTDLADKEFAAVLTANGIKFAATDTLDEELAAAATFATYNEKFKTVTALTNFDEEFGAIFADSDGGFIATDTLDEEIVDANTFALTTDEEFYDTTPAHHDVKFDTNFAGYDGEYIATDALDEKSTNVALAYNDEQFDEIPTPIFAYYDGECAAAHADYDEEVATIHASTKKEAAATFAIHDEKNAAVTGESGGA